MVNGGNSLDRISEFPDDVLRHILCLLPMKSAAGTVVLSRRWEKLFSSIPDLDFKSITASSGDELDLIIHHVLSGRDKNSNITTLNIQSPFSSMTLDSLIECVRGTHIRELDLHTPNHIYIDTPFNMFMINCESLQVLSLHFMHPVFNPPPPPPAQSLVQFKSLHTMTLSRIFSDSFPIFTDAMFPRLKKLRLFCCYNVPVLNFKCIELEDLVLQACHNLILLDIYGFKLERLTVFACFRRHTRDRNIKIFAPLIKNLEWVENYIISVPVLDKSLSLLDHADIGFMIHHHDHNFDHILGPELTYTWSAFFMGLSKVKTLKFHYPFTEVLAKNDFKRVLVNKFDNLTKLEICTEFNGDNSLQVLATLFKISPNIHHLVIKISQHDNMSHHVHNADKYWEDQIPEISSFLNHLKRVEFVEFTEHNQQVCSLAKFLLKQGKVLENMILRLSSNSIMSIMKLFWTSSSKVEIVFP